MDLPSEASKHGRKTTSHKLEDQKKLEQVCPTLFLEIYHPSGFHSNPYKVHLIQQLEQGGPTLLQGKYSPVCFH